MAIDSYTTDYTPPYWCELQPMELWNSNLKTDYRAWDTAARTANVGNSVRIFANAVTTQDVIGWVGKTDDVCRRVVLRDPSVLRELQIAILAGGGPA